VASWTTSSLALWSPWSWRARGVIATERKIIDATNLMASEPGTICGDFAVDIGRSDLVLNFISDLLSPLFISVVQWSCLIFVSATNSSKIQLELPYYVLMLTHWDPSYSTLKLFYFIVMLKIFTRLINPTEFVKRNSLFCVVKLNMICI
jgi:hypothetical protein